MAKESMEKLEACAAALRRHHFDAVAVGNTAEAFAVMKAAAEECRPRLASFGDSMTMRATGIVEWLAGNDEIVLLDGFDASKPYKERLEIRRQALMSDFFVTGVNAVTEAGTLHWLDKVGNRIAPVAFGPRKVVIVAGRNKVVADRDAAEERIRRRTSPATRDSARPAPKRASVRTAMRRTGSAIPGWRCCAAGPTNGCWWY